MSAARLAASDPVMAALIERVGEIDLETRLRRRREERPADAYGALLRAIVGGQRIAGGRVRVLGGPAGSPPGRGRGGDMTEAASV